MMIVDNLEDVTEAIILVGGLGTRLRSLVSDVPKPMADVNGKPFLSLILDSLIGTGINKVILAVGYKSSIIIDYYGKYYKNIDLIYSIETTPAGTAGAVYLASNYVIKKNVLILNGDTYNEIDFNDFKSFFLKIKKPIIAVNRIKNEERFGSICINKNKIISFNNTKENKYINIGIYIIPKKRLRSILKHGFKSLEQEFFPHDIKLYNDYYFYENKGKFVDIGTPKDYLELIKMKLDENGINK